jgi:hypothetical protein
MRITFIQQIQKGFHRWVHTPLILRIPSSGERIKGKIMS